MNRATNHLAALELEAIHIIREVVAEARNSVMLFSAGKELDGDGASGHPSLRSGNATVSIAPCGLRPGNSDH